MEPITRIANNGEPQRIYTLEAPLSEGQFTVRYQPLSENQMEALLDADLKKFSAMKGTDGKSAIDIPHWREALLVFPKVNPDVDVSNLELSVDTSFHVRALRRGFANDITPATVLGLVETKDRKLIYGVRGGSLQIGQANVAPGGHVMPHKKYSQNPIFSSYREERVEETGIQKTVEDVLIGHQTDPVFKSVCFVIRGRTVLDSKAINEMHREAFAVYDEAKKANVPELDARKKIADAGFKNIDAWENSELIFLDADPQYVRQVVAAGKVQHNGHELQTFDNSIGALIMYLNSQHK